jgi:hypothetical protein
MARGPKPNAGINLKNKGPATGESEAEENPTRSNEWSVSVLPSEDPRKQVSQAALDAVSTKVQAFVDSLTMPPGSPPSSEQPTSEEPSFKMSSLVDVGPGSIDTTAQAMKLLSKAAKAIVKGTLEQVMDRCIFIHLCIDLSVCWANQQPGGARKFEDEGYASTRHFGLTRFFVMNWAINYQRNKWRQRLERIVKKSKTQTVYSITGKPVPGACDPPGRCCFFN